MARPHGWPAALAFVAFLAASLAGCRRGAVVSTSDAPAVLRIAVVPKGTTRAFWKSAHAGAVKAARELGVSVVWRGPIPEGDVQDQIDIVRSFVAQGVGGIALAPIAGPGTALAGVVKQSTAARIPVVAFDSGLSGCDLVSFVGSDDEAAGRSAGEALAKAVGKGRILVARDPEASGDREKGFLEAVRARPEVTIGSESKVAGVTSDFQGVFAPSEAATLAALRELRQAGLAGKVHLVGFDASDELVQAVRSGEIDALVVRRPFDMGYLAVKSVVAHIRGDGVEPRIDTGSVLVTRENVDAPDMRALVEPDLRVWLGF